MLWSGIFLWNAPALVEPTTMTTTLASSLGQLVWSFRRVGLAFLGPAFLWVLFDAQAKGRILDETRQANLRKYGYYGTNAEYTNYIDTTPHILPHPRHIWRCIVVPTINKKTV